MQFSPLLWRTGIVLASLGSIAAAWAQSEPDLQFGSVQRDPNGWVNLRGGKSSSHYFILLQASTNLSDWCGVARLEGLPFEFEDRTACGKPQRFYRYSVKPVSEEDDWKNQVQFGYSPQRGFERFRQTGGQFSYVKFVIRADDPTRVYYADSRRYLFHRDFVSARLEPFLGIGLGEFERITRFNEGRKLYLGSVLMDFSFFEYGIQFDAADPLSPETVRDLFELVASTVIDGRTTNSAPVRAYYIPSFDQARATQAHEGFFESNNIPVAGLEHWSLASVCYSSGWHFGRLRFVTATNIQAAYAAGQLLPTDVLLTDGVPAEIPYVSGIITLQPATPNSHVVLLAQSFAVPFAYLHGTNEQQRVRALDGQEVAFRARKRYYSNGDDICIFALPGDLDSTLKAELLSLKSNAPVRIAAKAYYGSYFAPTDILWPSNICHFGGKAANYGLLRRTIPTNAPVAMAVSMDLWDDFLDQSLPNGTVLRNEIASRLSPFNAVTNVAAFTNTLAGIRDLIRRTAAFTPAQQQAITNALATFGFVPTRKIRFRSSTNVEDSEAFSGAGLYDSYSGCLADDLDGDTAGPCRCDENEPNERGVFRAIQRVYASFYNDNAYLARRLHNIDESTIGMGVLVHYSTPDEEELANGVATVTASWSSSGGQSFPCTMVTQKGALPVANPQGTTQAEVQQGCYTSYPDGYSFFYMSPSSYSSLVPLGTCVMDYPTNYDAFLLMFVNVARAYRAVFPDRPRFTLDLEYKKVAPGKLEVKQVREVPQASRTNLITPYLIDAPLVLRSDQGVEQDTLVAHRLKSRWTFRSRNMQLTPENIAQGIFSEVTWERAHNGRVETFQGRMEQLPGYSQSTNRFGSGLDIQWTADTPDGPARFKLSDCLWWGSQYVVPASDPWIALSDAGGLGLTAEYDRPQLWFAYGTGLTNDLREDSIGLALAAVPEASDSRLEYDFVITNATRTIRIRTGFWATNPDIYTDYPRLKGEMETRIEGLTSAPIELRGFFSQTWSSVHYRYADRFVFEPRLEENIPPEILSELNAANVRFLLVTHLDNIPRLQIMGLDGVLRDWIEVKR